MAGGGTTWRGKTAVLNADLLGTCEPLGADYEANGARRETQ